MSEIRFNHVFVSLMALSVLTAFVINPRYTNRVRNVQAMFAPVAAPTRRIASVFHQKYGRAADEDDRRAGADVRAENERLRTAMFSLSGQLEELKRINSDRNQVGDLRPLCTPVKVIGSDTGTRESLIIQGAADEITSGMPVIYGGGLVGRIDRAGTGGAQIEMVTDKNFKATARFVRMVRGPDANLSAQSLHNSVALAQGAGRDSSGGRGWIVVNSFPIKDAEQIQEGDDLLLDDGDWPVNMKWQRLGRVVKKTPRRDAPLFVEIRVEPLRNLKELKEVMVLTR